VTVRGRGQEPPDVTCGEPELADGADEPWRPPLELAELDELDLDEPAVPDAPALPLAPAPDVPRLAALAVCAEPGRV
jgi:hypothetical protein